jgi:dihydropyrimidine dehydrogenase (NAD+) subunit PreT
MAVSTPELPSELRPPLTGDETVLEADRCLECGDVHAPAPCVVACPADVDVPRFIRALAAGDPELAARTIFDENLLGGTCARVCPVEVLCEGACVLISEGQKPIEVARLQRSATDWALARGLDLREARPSTGRRIAVIGAGPAGLASAGELAAHGHAVTIFDERDEVGGLARFAIAPYRIEREPLPAEAELLERLGVEFRLATSIDSPAALRKLESDYDAIVLAVGLGEDTDVRYPGDDLQGVWQSLEFVEALKTGRPPVVGVNVVVVGGGNTAVDLAREALRLGAERVTLVYRRGEAEMPAYPHEVEEAREEGVEFRFLAAPVRFLGRTRLEAVECREMRLGDPDESGRRRPVEAAGTEFVLAADTVVLGIGQQPRAEFLAWIDGLVVEGGRVVVEPATGRTGNPKYFAAGDASGGTTVVEAVRDAKLVARALEVSR